MYNLPGLLLQLPFLNNDCLKEEVWDTLGWGWVDESSTPFKSSLLALTCVPLSSVCSHGELASGCLLFGHYLLLV